MQTSKATMREANKFCSDSISQTDSVYYFLDIDEPAHLDKKDQHEECKTKKKGSAHSTIYYYFQRKAFEIIQETYPPMCYECLPFKWYAFLSLIVEKDGSISNVKIYYVKVDGEKANKEEFQRVKEWIDEIVNGLPCLIPARHKGKVVRESFFLPVRFERF